MALASLGDNALALLLFSAPEIRGEGSRLLHECKVWAKENGYSDILLDWYTDSGILEPYYQSRGFKTIEKRRFTFGERSFSSALVKLIL